jgi:hypothetical protein
MEVSCAQCVPDCSKLTLSCCLPLSPSVLPFWLRSREFNHRIKGIGHSSFTQEEAEFVATHGNEKVNSVYLSKYDASYDRMHCPDATYGDVDPVLLRTWLRRKYIDKAWYKVDLSLEEKLGRSLKVASGDKTGSKATIIKIPPKTSDAVPINDFFLSDNKDKPEPAASTVDESWDAFGSRGDQFDATFGTMEPTTDQSGIGANTTQDALFHADFDQLKSTESSGFVEYRVDAEQSIPPQVTGSYAIENRYLSQSYNSELPHRVPPTGQPEFTFDDPSHTMKRNAQPLVHMSHPINAGIDSLYSPRDGSRPNHDDRLTPSYLHTHTSPEIVRVDAIGAAFDSLVDQMTRNSNMQMNSRGFVTEEDLNEINVLLQKCTRPQLRLVLHYIHQLLTKQTDTHERA